jgi:hypothetical protein
MTVICSVWELSVHFCPQGAKAVRNAWECLYTLFHDELTRMSNEALANGVPPERLAEQLDERIARLRLEIATPDQP